LRAGETLLVLGAAGGVGIAAVELGKMLGARVIAAASSDDKVAFCRAHGADEGIQYAREDLKERVKALTRGDGADVIYDPVGGAYAEPALRSIAWQGRYLVVGFASGDIPKIPLNLALLKSCQIVGVFWGAWAERDPKGFVQHQDDLLALYAAGKVRPRISGRYPLKDAGQAIAHLGERRALGKIVVTMD
jgi:NADPH2:quinone reductase